MSSSANGEGGVRRATGGQPRRLAFVVLAVIILLAASGSARSSDVPASVQAGLISKVAGFDRNFHTRAGERATVLIVQAADNAESARSANAIESALKKLDTIGGLPHEEAKVTYTSASELAAMVRRRKAAIVYFASGLSDHVPAIRGEFSSLNVLTFGAVPDDVPAGIVLGVDLVSSRPKLLINLTQAKKQKVSMPASVLNLMKVYQ